MQRSEPFMPGWLGFAMETDYLVSCKISLGAATVLQKML
jgi:hypothetical protein